MTPITDHLRRRIRDAVPGGIAVDVERYNADDGNRYPPGMPAPHGARVLVTLDRGVLGGVALDVAAETSDAAILAAVLDRVGGRLRRPSRRSPSAWRR